MEPEKKTLEESLQEELEQLRKSNEGTQDLIKRWGTEMGEARKQQEEISKAADLLKSLEEKIASLEGATGSPKGAGVAEPNDEPDVDELESSLTEAQRKAAQDAYEAADDADKKLIVENETVRRQFFIEAKSADSGVPESPWKKLASGSAPEEDLDNKIKSLFNAEKARSKKVPGGPRGGSGGDFTPEEPVERRTVPVAGGGVLDAIKRSNDREQ